MVARAFLYLEPSMFKHFPLNAAGSDFVVGDVHGCFAKLQAKLDEIGFDPSKDRLFSVGDLVDRGPASDEVLEWLAKPWFHAVRGNHEQMAIDAAAGLFDAGTYIYNGGAWFLGLTQPERQLFADAFSALPIAIEVETKDGLIGIVHADCPVADWADMRTALEGRNGESFAQTCIWSRDRANYKLTTEIKGVKSVIVGHTPMKTDIWLGNVHYIDTGAVFGHELTVTRIN
jgi:serine/threonine protein phosphatase 1